MSASHIPVRVRWILPVFGLALALAALVSLIVILNASAAPPAPLEVAHAAALKDAASPPSLQPPARIPSASPFAPPARTAPMSMYRPPSGRSTSAQFATEVRQEREDPLEALRHAPTAGRPGRLIRGSTLAPAAVAAGKVITFELDGTVLGYTDANSPVHLQLTRSGTPVGEARARSDGLGYFSAELMRDGRYAQVQPGDLLQVNATSDAETLTAPNITGTVNPGPNTVTGQIIGVPRPANLRINAWGNALPVTTDGSGNFAVDFTSRVDLTWFTEVSVSYRDADGDWLTAWLYPQDGMVIGATWNAVSGYTDPGSPVTVTVNHGGNIQVRSTTSEARFGWWELNFDAVGAGDIVTAEVGGGTIVATVPAVTAVADAGLDRLSGVAPPGMSLSLGHGLRHELTWRMDSRSVVADPGGAYATTFPAGQVDALASMYVFPHVTAAADLYLYASPHSAIAHWAWNEVYGYANAGATIVAQLTDGASHPAILETVEAKADKSGYYWASFSTPFQVGQHVLVLGGGLDEDILLDELTVHLDVATDLVSGRVPANADLTLNPYAGSGGLSYRDNTSAGVGGDYQLALAGILDLRNGGRAATFHPQGNDEDQDAWLGVWCSAPYLEVDETHDSVWGSVDKPNVPVTLTLKTGAGAVKGVIQAGSNTDCRFYGHKFTDNSGSTIDIAPGDRVEFARPGWSQEVVAVGMDVRVDPVADRVTGTGPANTFLEVTNWETGQVLRVPTAANGSFIADFSGLADFTGGSQVEVATFDNNWNMPYVVGTVPYARANVDWDSVDGWFGPGVTVQYTVTDGKGAYKGGATGVAKADGWLDGIGCGCDMQFGDHVAVHTATGFTAELELISITGAIDVDADRISGQMRKGVFPGRGNIWVWSPTRNEGSGRDMDIDAGGNYTVDFAPKFDIRNGDNAEVWYYDANRNQVGVMLYTPYLQVRANRAHDWVQGDATPQTTVFVTVTREGQIIGTGQSFTGGGTGWQVYPQRPEGGNLDMRTGDIVDVTAGTLSASVLLIDMEGAVDAATDVVSGKLVGVPFPADVQIEVWRDNGQNRNLQTDAAGNFSIDFDTFDIHQGDNVGIWYVRPDGHMVGIVRSDFRFEVELRDNDLWGIATPRSASIWRSGPPAAPSEVRPPSGPTRRATTGPAFGTMQASGSTSRPATSSAARVARSTQP